MRKILIRLLKNLLLRIDVDSVTTYSDLSGSTEKLLSENDTQISIILQHFGRSFFRICNLYSMITRKEKEKEEEVIKLILNCEIVLCKSYIDRLPYLLNKKE
jgi:hypothetical protein